MDIALPSWKLPPLERADLGPYGDFPRLSDADKQEVWKSYRSENPSRTPVLLATNNRVFMGVPELNAPRLRYRDVFADPEAMLLAQLWHQYVARMRHHLFCDYETDLPEVWKVSAHYQNVYEAAFFGAPMEYRGDEVPDTSPPYSGAGKERVFDVDIDHPTERGFFREAIDMTHALERVARDRTFWGRPIRIEPYLPIGTDGPLTVAMNIRGQEILTDLTEDPDYVRRLFDFIVTAALTRHRAFRSYWGVDARKDEGIGMADDSVAMLGAAQYREWVLPHHQKWFRSLDPEGNRPRSMHLCGDAQRHFRTIRDELGVRSFDTGFPVDFTRLRAEMGPEVEVLGGVEVGLLLTGTPAAVYRRARAILGSGIRSGGRFVLREANNLPPAVPWANLAAMYSAVFDVGSDAGPD